MASPREDATWEAFQRWIRDAQPMLDGMVPVALIFVPATTDADGALQLDLEGQHRILWPATLPPAERGPLLARLGKRYGEGTVIRA